MIDFKCLIFFALISVGRCAYQDDLARNWIWPLTVDSYNHGVQSCIGNTLGAASNYEFGAQITVKCDDHSSKDSCSGYTVALHPQKAVLITFRGTISESQVGQEINYTLSQPLLPFIGGGKVNGYFLNGYNLLWNAGLKDSFLKLKNKYPTYKIWVAGHSLGAALASITAASLTATKLITKDQLLLYTFGQPRVGDKAFADAYPSLVPEAYRIVHHWDIIPHLPTAGFMGYTHHKSEVWYNNNMKKGDPYIICAEEESLLCSNSVLTPTESDHGEYFGLRNYLGNHECVPAGTF
uniref:Fungal lipase-like domain-containing protein n=1 Tax=Panagrolaimus sp. ES5 TaxID=591445 RepID=A0AC34FVI6_9BILA